MEFWEMWPPEEHERLIENMSAWMDGELPDIASTPEAGGPDDLELEVAEHQACCPSCRDLFEELKELRAGFETLPEPDPPEGFAQGVMDRIRAAEKPKVIPLFKRPQVRALAGLAACLVLVAGLYGASRFQHQDLPLPRSYGKDAVEEMDEVSACEALTAPELEDVPQIAAYSVPEAMGGAPLDARKAVPDSGADGLSSDWADAEVTLILDRLPQGAEEVLPPDAAVVYDEEAGGDVYTWLTAEELAAIEKLAFEQGMIAGTTEIFPSPTGARCALIVRRG